MRFQRVLHFLVILSLVISMGGSIAFAATEYGISTNTDIDTPDRTVTVEGSEYDVSAVARVYDGESFTVNTDAPAGSSYDIYIYNSDRDIVDTAAAEGDDSASFDTEYFGSSGSYIAAIYADGSIERIHPVVVSPYRVSVDSPSSLETGTSAEVDVSLTEITEAPDPYSVEVVFTKDDSVVERLEASETGSLSYQASLSNELSEGTYDVYAVVRNETTVDGKHEIIGISDTQSLTVEPSATETTGSSGGGSSGSAETTTTDPQTSTTTPTTTAKETTTETSTEQTSQTTTTETVSSTTTTETTQTTTDSSVLTPNTSTDESPSETTTESALPAPWIPALGVLLVGTILALRSQS